MNGNNNNKFGDVELLVLLDEDDSQTQPIDQERWERFKGPMDGYNASWTTGKWKSAKTHVTFCSFDTKGSRFCIVPYSIIQGIKSWFILRIPTWVDPGAPSTSTARPNRFGRKKIPQCLVEKNSHFILSTPRISCSSPPFLTHPKFTTRFVTGKRSTTGRSSSVASLRGNELRTRLLLSSHGIAVESRTTTCAELILAADPPTRSLPARQSRFHGRAALGGELAEISISGSSSD